MRKFSSYGSIDTKLHYYAPREALISTAYRLLVGDNPEQGGHYITVWAPRQSGKTWLMQQVTAHLKQQGDFEVAITTMQSAKTETTAKGVLEVLVTNLRSWFKRDFPYITTWRELRSLFTQEYFERPLILILDEFDSLDQEVINQCANEFRSIYTERQNEIDKSSAQKTYLLHGLALIGVRAVLGIENVSGSPFNVQRSLPVPNLTYPEVEGMFKWYEQESGQAVEQAVIGQLFYETQGQPGLTCWLGELLTETYNRSPDRPITLEIFEEAYAAAIDVLPNNNILNIISKAREEPYRYFVLEMFKTQARIRFKYEDRQINYLYLNGVVGIEQAARTEYYVKFACPLIQKRLFNYFAYDLFKNIGRLYDPFDNLEDTISPAGLNIKNLIRRYEQYLQQNRTWLFKDAPRRSTDLGIYEAIYHFNLYMYLTRFLDSYEGRVYPEFPAGNGQIDLLIDYAGQRYGLELKSFTNRRDYQKARQQAARYGRQLGLSQISLVLFVDDVDEENRQTFEETYVDEETGVTVQPVFVATAA